MFTFDLPLKTKMATMTGIAIGGLLLFGWVARGTLEELKVNGPLYRSITESKDMVADYVPPDGSVIEAFTLVSSIEDQRDDSKRNLLTDKLRKKRADEAAVFDLHKAQGDGEMRKAVAAVHSTAVTFFDAVDSGYLPRIAAKDRTGGAEFRIRRLGPLYTANQEAVAEAVKLASKAVELNEASARQTAASRTMILMSVGMAILIVTLTLSFAITRSILNPVRELTAVSRQIAVGDLSATVVYQARDEFGVLANSFRDLSGYIRGVADATGALAKGDLTVRIQPKSDQDVLSLSFNGAASSLAKIIQNVTGVADALNGAAGKVSLASGSVQTQNQETNSQVTAVSAAVSRIGAHVETAAAGAEEMSATVTEITRNSQHAKEIADSALNLVTSASHTIGTLGESSAAIGKMVKIISGIAGQTQMLALNATMESARAGEQGKGFAVVANEVKELAKGTAKATAEISAQIAAIQRDSEGAVQSIQKISEVMRDINDTQGSILASLEEQSAAALEMSTTLSEMAHNATEIGESVSHVTDAVIQTTEGVATTFAAADELTTMSASLRSLVGVFKAGDKVAA